MKTASVRDMRHDFNQVLAWVSNGEEVTITKHRRVVARLVPARDRKKTDAPMPDIADRLHKVFGGKVISDQAMGAIIDASRGAY